MFYYAITLLQSTLIKRQWTLSMDLAGRPQTTAEVEALVIRLARENLRWGADRIHSELVKPGIDLGSTERPG